MCGIAGKVNWGGAVDAALLEKMCARLTHRGPDEGGVWTGGPAGLAMRRLKVIDLVSGQQPMDNGRCPAAAKTGPLRLVYNGEIYNHQVLRRELEAKGHKFTSHADTEVILHLFEEEGEKTWARLAGMFAIALWSERERTLHLVRDQMGVKPLYYARTAGGVAFASEIKSLLADPDVSREWDRGALDDYFSVGYVPAPRTAFRAIQKLPPARALALREGEGALKDYWNFSPPSPGGSLGESLARLDGLLAGVVKDQLVSDVPLGLFLSGGLDSSAVAYYARQAGQALDSFTIFFDAESFSERKEAALTAKKLGLRHHEEEMKPAPDVLQALGRIFDEPLADPSILPTYYLSRLARRQVTVALSGDGGDEIFAGYPTYIADRYARAYSLLPRPLRTLALKTAEALPASFDRIPWDYRLKAFLRAAGRPQPHAHRGWLEVFSAETKRHLYGSAFAADGQTLAAEWEALYAASGDRSFLERMMFLDQKTRLPDQYLVKVDRLSMAHSLEVRVPLLDHRVVEFAAGVPARQKLRGFTTKFVFRKLMEDRLPPEVLNGAKKGFAPPLARWLAGPLHGWAENMLAPERVAKTGLLNPEFPRRLLAGHGRADNHRPLWAILCFMMWAENYPE